MSPTSMIGAPLHTLLARPPMLQTPAGSLDFSINCAPFLSTLVHLNGMCLHVRKSLFQPWLTVPLLSKELAQRAGNEHAGLKAV